jgi:3',5'-nucleoside bisphosphate phosphatase
MESFFSETGHLNYMALDLHTHTTASDGTLTPEELIALAANNGVTVLAIADHDTVSAIERAKEHSRRFQLELIPAVEINTEVGSMEIHILGYFIDCNNALLNSKLQDLRNFRLTRNEKIVGLFREAGFSITIDEVMECARGETVGRPHIARVLVNRGYFRDIQEVFENYLRPGCRAYVPRSRFSPEEAIGLIRHSGGFPVLAHPGYNSFDDAYIDGLIKAGLRGLEVYYPAHLPLQVDFYRAQAMKKKLFITGGSDFHGFDSMHYNRLGAPGYGMKDYQALRAAALAEGRI